MNEWMKNQVNEWIIMWMIMWMIKWMNDQVKNQVNNQVNDQVNNQVNEWPSEWKTKQSWKLTLSSSINRTIIQDRLKEIQDGLFRNSIQLLLTLLVIMTIQQLFTVFTNKPHTHLSQGHLRLVALQEHKQLVNLLVTPLQSLIRYRMIIPLLHYQ